MHLFSPFPETHRGSMASSSNYRLRGRFLGRPDPVQFFGIELLGSFSALWGRLRLAGQRQKSRILQENQAVVRQHGANPPGRFHCLATNIIFDRFLVLCVKTKLREVSILCDFGITSLTLEHRQARPSASASSALPNRRRSLADDR
jgi:hypothetical protein